MANHRGKLGLIAVARLSHEGRHKQKPRPLPRSGFFHLSAAAPTLPEPPLRFGDDDTNQTGACSKKFSFPCPSTGEAIETAWDIFNIGLGVASFIDNVRTGSYGSAAVDAVGVVIDSAAAVVPFVPGGVGAGIKAVRVADRVADAADLVTASNRIDNAVDASRTTANLVTDAAQGKVAKGAANPKVKEALARGQEAHKQADYGPGFKKEVTLPSGKRMDAYNKTDKRVVELKGANPRAVNRGEKQVKQYCKECDEVYGPGHTGEVRTYK